MGMRAGRHRGGAGVPAARGGIHQGGGPRPAAGRQTISALPEGVGRECEAKHGCAPDARALGKRRPWANHASRRGKEEGPLDLAAEAWRWAERARASEAGALEPVMSAVTSRRG